MIIWEEGEPGSVQLETENILSCGSESTNIHTYTYTYILYYLSPMGLFKDNYLN